MLREILAFPCDPCPGPEQRAEALLLRHLTPDQQKTYLEFGWFEVRGQDGSIWTIDRNGGTQNVTCLCRNGTRVYCTYLADTPRADTLLAQKLTIEATGGRGLPRTEGGVLRDEHLFHLPPPRFADIGAPGALGLEQAALRHRKRDLLRPAARRLRQAVALAGPAIRPHLLNNYALVLMRAGKFGAARRVNAGAWRLQDGGHDVTAARILIVRIALRFFAGHRDVALYLGQLKTLLDRGALPCRGGVMHEWDVRDVIDLLRTELRNDGELLVQAIRVLADSTARDVLELFPAWSAAPPSSLEVPWPDD